MRRTPPLLVGALLVVWGIGVQPWWLGVALALAFEGSRVTNLRLRARQRDVTLASMLCFLAVLGGMVLLRLGGNSALAVVMKTIGWLPVSLAPLGLLTAWADPGRVTLATVGRRAPESSAPTPNQDPDRGFGASFDWIFATATVLAIGTANREGLLFFGVMVGAATWALWAVRATHVRVTAWGLAIILSAVVGYGGPDGAVSSAERGHRLHRRFDHR